MSTIFERLVGFKTAYEWLSALAAVSLALVCIKYLFNKKRANELHGKFQGLPIYNNNRLHELNAYMYQALF